MAESSWADKKRGQSKNILWIIVGILAVGFAIGLFIRNNSDLLLSKNKKNESPVQAARESAQSAQPQNDAVFSTVEKPAVEEVKAPQEKIEQRPKDNAVVPKKAEPQPIQKAVEPTQKIVQESLPVVADLPKDSVALAGILCKLIDKTQPKLKVSLKLSFSANKDLKKEILVKRDNLKVMVQKSLSGKSLDDIVVDSLRIGLRSGLNSLLEKGQIADIEFTEFTLQQER